MEENIFNVEIIENYMKENNLTKKEFCRGCGLMPSTFERIFWGHIGVDLKTINKVASFMNIPLGRLFKQ